LFYNLLTLGGPDLFSNLFVLARSVPDESYFRKSTVHLNFDIYFFFYLQ